MTRVWFIIWAASIYSKLDENVAMMFQRKRTPTSNGEVSNFPLNMLCTLCWLNECSLCISRQWCCCRRNFHFRKYGGEICRLKTNRVGHVNGLLCASFVWMKSVVRQMRQKAFRNSISFPNYGRVSTTDCFNFSSLHTLFFHQLHFEYSQRIKVHVSWINWMIWVWLNLIACWLNAHWNKLDAH